MHIIDVAALMPLVNELVLGALTALASVAAARLCAWLKARRDGELGQILDRALGMGIRFALAKLGEAAAAHGQVNVRSEIVAEAANYALVQVPQTVKALGLDGAALGRMIEARLGAGAAGGTAP